MDELVRVAEEFGKGRISRRQFIERVVAAGLTASAAGAVLAGCGATSGSASESSPAAADTTKPAKLYFYNWTEYMPPSLVKSFERDTGITVVQSYFDDNEALLAKLKAGARGYDVIVPSDYMVSIMAKTGLLEPLNMSLLPNFKYVDPKFKKPAYDPETDGKKYSVPYQWGNTGIGVRTDKVSEEVTSYQILWNPKYKAQIDMLNDERETPAVALYLLGFSPNTTTQSELDQAIDLLIKQKPLVRAYDSANQRRALLTGRALVHCWDGDARKVSATLREQGQSGDLVKYVLPPEGFDLWTDNMCIPVGAQSTYGAHLFMDYMLTPKAQAALADYAWSLSPVSASRPLTDPELVSDLPTEQQMESGHVILDLGAFAQQYTEGWAKLKAS